MKVRLLGDRVLVEPKAPEEKTKSGLFIPDTAKETQQIGCVVAVGNGRKDDPMTIKTGETVLYGKFSGSTIEIEGKEYLLMRETDIFAVL